MRREGGLGDLGGLFASVIRMSCSDFIYLASENKPTRPPKPPLNSFCTFREMNTGVGRLKSLALLAPKPCA